MTNIRLKYIPLYFVKRKHSPQHFSMCKHIRQHSVIRKHIQRYCSQWNTLLKFMHGIAHHDLARRQTSETGSGVAAFTDWAAQVKMQQYINRYTFCHLQYHTCIARCLMFVAGALRYQSSPKQIEICMFETTSDAHIWFWMASWATLLVVVKHK